MEGGLRHGDDMTENDGQDRLFGPNPSGLDESPHGMMVLVIVGMIVGLLSGMFGIGGGTVIVPALVWLGLSQRHAGDRTDVDFRCDFLCAQWQRRLGRGLLLFVGMFAGGQFGSWLLSRLPELVLRWVFVVFLIFVTANQVIFTPSRDQRIFMSVVTGIGLVLLGVVIGTLAGLLGIGGGALAVPALSILFGASDLIARGTSLLAMFPNSITTSVANMKRKLVHIKAGLIIGVIAALTTPFGTWVAGAVSPRAGAIMFAAYLCVLLVRSFFVAVKATRAARGSRA